MRKTLIIVFALMLLIFPMINAIALYSAQDVAKEYMQSNEYLDSSFYYVKCDLNEYYLIGILDNKTDLSFFVPVESNTGKVLFQTTENTRSILKTALLYRTVTLKTKTGNNYLSQQLLDKIDNLNTVLKSKDAKYDGIIKSNYSSVINQKVVAAKKELNVLITELTTLNIAMSKLQKEQSVFLDTSDCRNTDDLLYLYKTSFSGYNKLVSESISYKDSINDIIEVVVADKIQDETTKRTILSYVEAPTSLSSEIGTISDYLSSTSQFYQEILSEFERTGPNSSVEILVTKIKAKQDFYSVKTTLYSYDSELKESLNTSITYILNENNVIYWKDRKTVTELNQNYNQIIELYNKGKYLELQTKLSLAKNQVKKINAAGIIETTESTNYEYYIFAGSGLIILLAIIFFFKKFSNVKKKTKIKKPSSSDPEYLFNKRDPFR